MSWILLIILAVALVATMVGWAVVVASSLNHTMHALNGNGPGLKRGVGRLTDPRGCVGAHATLGAAVHGRVAEFSP